MFEYALLPKETLEQITTPKGRYYVDKDGGKYISVTTVIDKNSDKTSLNEWKARVGEKEAAKVSNNATRRGTLLHKAVEDFLLEDLTDFPNEEIKQMFLTLKPHLAKNIHKIYGIEHRMYSKKLHVAGTADVICEWDGVPSIVDIKTSRRIKKREYIVNYFVQSTVYALMCYEMYGIKVPQFVIIIAVDDEHPQIFKERVMDWVPQVKSMFSNTKSLIDELVDA